MPFFNFRKNKRKKVKKPTPEEAMAIILAGAPVNRKVQLQREMSKGNKKQRGNRNKKDKRDKMERDVRRETGLNKKQVDIALVEMYDELAAFGLLKVRNVRR